MTGTLPNKRGFLFLAMVMSYCDAFFMHSIILFRVDQNFEDDKLESDKEEEEKNLQFGIESVTQLMHFLNGKISADVLVARLSFTAAAIGLIVPDKEEEIKDAS